MLAFLTRIELRRQWRSVALLAVLVAVVVGTVLASVAGARRSGSAFDRYLDRLQTPDVLAFGDPSALEDLGDLPFVEATPSLELAAISPVGAPANAFFPMAVSKEGLVPYEYFRSPVIDGRLADPDEPLEVALGERTASRLDVEVGDALPMESYSGLSSDDVGDESGDPKADGPRFDLAVVGIVRDPGDITARETDIALTFLTPAFRDQFDMREIGTIGEGKFVVLDDPDDIGRLTSALSGEEVELDGGFSAAGQRRQIGPTMGAIATALRIFAAVVAVAGAAALVHTVSRMQVAASADDPALSALGVGRTARWARLTAPAGLAVIIGGVMGIGLAAAASPLFPMGLARRAEPNLGVDLDPLVLLGGGGLAILCGLIVTTGLARLHARVGDTDPARQRAGLSKRAADAGAPPTMVAGLTLATGTGQGSRSTATAAVAGAAFGVLGVMAAVMVAASTERLEATPSLYGWGWDANIAGSNLSHLDDGVFDVERLVEDPDVTMVAALTQQLPVTIDDQPTQAMSARDLKGHLRPVIVEGREPTGPDELALGRVTLDDVDKSVGETVTVRFGDAVQRLRVAGVVALPVTEDGGASGSGVFLPSAAAEALGFDGGCDESSSCFRNAAIAVGPGVALADIERRYRDDEAQVAVDLPTPPGEVERLTAIANLPWFLAGFLALLAAVAVTYAAAVAVRRRRRDLAVLRVLGMSAAQLRAVVAFQVLSLTAAGAALGAIGGFVTGRIVWRLVVDSLSLPFSPAAPTLALVALPVATLFLTQLAATSSRRAAGRTPAASILRTE